MSTKPSFTHSRFTPPRRRVRNAVLAFLLGGTVLTSGVASVLTVSHQSAMAAEPAAATRAVPLPNSFADLVDRVTPAVVTITTTAAVPSAAESDMPQFPPGSPFEQFFRQFGDPFGGDGMPQQEMHALGSGFIIDPNGSIVTNNHVVDNAKEVSVTLKDGTELQAKVVGRDPKTDLALLKIDAGHPLPYLRFGDSDQVRVGDWVVAVGNPFGLGGTVTAGIVSARGRDIHSGPYDDYLQIDAPINRGNSGGPTFDVNGNVIGINAAIFSPSGGSVGIGFAIPSNMARQVVAQLEEHGRVERGWLGVQIQPMTPELRDGLGLKEDKGALVVTVTPDSPAARAGVRQGDVIMAFGGQPVDTVHSLTRAVADAKAGTVEKLTVWRDGRERTLTAHIAQYPEEEQVASAESQPGPSGNAVLGMALAPLDPMVREQLGIGEDVKGVAVVGVEDQAGKLPLLPGDVIERVGNQPVAAPSDVEAQVRKAQEAGRKTVLALVNRDGNEMFVAVPLA